MPIREYLDLSLAVLADVRVIGAAVAILISWSLFRYVGLVYKKPRPPSARVAAKGATNRGAKARASAPAAPSTEGEEESL